MVKISACVIVKNEERNIGQWIDNVKNIADEMIVVDTGSTDKTVEIAEKGGANVFHFEWRDDFSAAKNYAWSKAKGEWIIFLDADEYFSVRAQKELRPLIEQINGNKKIVGINSPLHNIDADQGNHLISSMIQSRVFRNMKTLRYVGRIHESLDYTGKKAISFVDTDLAIYHTGYSSSLTRVKNERNLQLLLADIKAEGGEKPEHYTYLSATYLNLHDFEKAIHYARLSILTKTGGLMHAYVKQYRIWLKAMRGQGATNEQLQEVVDKALEDIPDFPDFLWEDATLAIGRKDFVRAEREIELLLERAKDEQLMRMYETTIKSEYPIVYSSLGLIRGMQGRDKEAAECFMEVLKSFSYSEAALLSVLDFRTNEDSIETIKYLQGIYDRKKDKPFLVKCLSSRPRDNVYLYFVQPPATSYEAMMGAGQFVGAAKTAAAQLMGVFQAGADAYARGENSEIWEIILPKKWKKTGKANTPRNKNSDVVIAFAVKFMRELSLALLSMPVKDLTNMAEELSLLPINMQNCILRFHGGDDKLTATDFDAYQTLSKEVLNYGSTDVINRFALLAIDFDDKKKIKAAATIIKKSRWQAALSIYKEIPADSEFADSDYWYKTALCYFHCGDKAKAKECFIEARDMGAVALDIPAYLTWCRQAAKAA